MKMEKMNVLTLIITLVVGIILTGALLGPVINDSTATERTFVNEGIYSMESFDDQAEINLTWDHTHPKTMTVNDEAVALPQSTTYPPSLVVSDSWAVRYIVQPNQVITLTLFDASSATKFSVNSDETNDLTIALSEGTATFTYGSSTVTETYTSGFVIANDGEYVMKNSDKVAYLKGDSVIYSTGRTGGLNQLTTNTVSIHLDGTIADGVAVTSLYPPAYTASDIVINAAADTKYIDLYRFENVTFTVIDTSSNTDSATYSQVIVPASVTAELTDHLTPGQISLMGAIPVMVIVALLMAAVGAIALRRAD